MFSSSRARLNLAKVSNRIKSFEDVQRALQELEKIINELSKDVNKEAETETSDAVGKTGDIQTTRNADGSYTIEVKTKDGWKTPVIGESAIKFKDKQSSISIPQTKSIDEIEAEDSNTGSSVANLTTFDEKSNKFILARPDYDSGWVEWDFSVRDTGNGSATMLQLSHELGVLPSLYLVYFAPGQSPSSITWFTMLDGKLTHHNNTGLATKVDDTKIYLVAGETHTFQGTAFVDPPTTVNYQDGSVKVLMWK